MTDRKPYRHRFPLSDAPSTIPLPPSPWLHEAARASLLPDVILLDLFLPIVSGLAILQAIQAFEALRHLHRE